MMPFSICDHNPFWTDGRLSSWLILKRSGLRWLVARVHCGMQKENLTKIHPTSSWREQTRKKESERERERERKWEWGEKKLAPAPLRHRILHFLCSAGSCCYASQRAFLGAHVCAFVSRCRKTCYTHYCDSMWFNYRPGSSGGLRGEGGWQESTKISKALVQTGWAEAPYLLKR